MCPGDGTNCPGGGNEPHQPHQHQSSACAWPAPMPIDANPSAPATAAPAAILLRVIVNSFISWLPCRYQRKLLAAQWQKRHGAHDYFLYVYRPTGCDR
jgi:hypothetical protein